MAKKRKKIKQGQNSLEAQQKAGNIDKDGYYTMPQVPQERGQLFNPVKLQKEISQNQQEILQTPAAKRRNREAEDPFKNGFFKKTEDQSMSKRFNPAAAKNAVDVAKEEQTNAQKLFAPATPDIQTDKAGNKLASKNGKPVGFSGTPKGAKAPDLGNRGNPNILGMTDAERAQNQQSIQNVAANFTPATIAERELEKRKKTAFTPPKDYKPQPVSSGVPPMLKQDKPVLPKAQTASLPSDFGQRAMTGQLQNPASGQGFSLPQVNLDPLGLAQSQPKGVEHLQGSAPTPQVGAKATLPYVLQALQQSQNAYGPEALNPQPQPADQVYQPESYVDDFSNKTPVAQAQQSNPDPNFWQQFAGVPTAIPIARVQPHQGRFPQPAHPMSLFGQQQNSPDFKARLQADQAQLLQGLPFNRRSTDPRVVTKPDQFVNQF